MKNELSLFKRLNRFIRFFKFEICVLSLITFCTFVWLSLLTGVISNLFGPTASFIISCFGWFVSLSLFAAILHMHSQNRCKIVEARIKILEECNIQLRRAKETLDWVIGFDQNLDKSVAIYSKLTKAIGTPAANALVNFSLTTGPNDTVFLIRLGHDIEKWHLQVAGKSVHLEQAKAILLATIAKIEEIAGPENIIQKKDLVSN